MKSPRFGNFFSHEGLRRRLAHILRPPLSSFVCAAGKQKCFLLHRKLATNRPAGASRNKICTRVKYLIIYFLEKRSRLKN